MMWKIIFILLISTEIYSQTVTFNTAIDFNEGWEYPISVIEENDGYAIFGAGTDFQDFQGWGGKKILKCDLMGGIQWKKVSGKIGVKYYFGASGSFIRLSSGGYAVALTQSDSANFSSRGYDAVLTKYNDAQDTLFTKIMGGNQDDEGLQVIETKDKGFALVGRTSSFGQGFYLVKTDSAGNMEWQNTYVHSSNSKGIFIAHAHDGGYVMSGWGYTPGYDLDTYVVKTDSAGNEQWKKRYGTRNNDGGGFIVTSSDSTYIVFGRIDTFNLTSTSGQHLASSYIMKINMSGDILWRYITNINWYHRFDMVREVAPGKGYIAIGQIWDSVYNNQNILGWLVRMDNDGNILWERRYAHPDLDNDWYNGFDDSEIEDVQPTGDGGFICLGITFNVNQDFWLLKLDSLGCMGDYCGLTDTNCYYLPYPDCDDTVGVGELSGIGYQDQRLRVYPNPARDEIFFLPIERGAQIEKIILHDLNGSVVLTQTERQTIDISHLPQGVYYYEAYVNSYLLRKDNIPVRGKIIRQ